MKSKVSIIFIIFIFSGMIFSCGISTFFNNVSNASAAISDANSAANEDISPEQEYYIGRAVAANLLGRYRLYTRNQNLTTYLNKICAAITINSPQPDIYNGYHVAILDTDEINAFATSGGHIFVTRGIIGAADTEDGLAGIIAHEVAHIQLKHGINAIKSSRKTQAMLVTNTAIAGVAGGTDVKQLTDALNDSFMEFVQTLVSNGYSKSQEFDADTKAVALMAAAGYNPAGLAKMLMSLGHFQKPDSGFGKTHPSPEERIANAQKSIKKHKATYKAARAKRFTTATK
jgi:beta-barrel assembly-enhancing protease